MLQLNHRIANRRLPTQHHAIDCGLQARRRVEADAAFHVFLNALGVSRKERQIGSTRLPVVHEARNAPGGVRSANLGDRYCVGMGDRLQEPIRGKTFATPTQLLRRLQQYLAHYCQQPAHSGLGYQSPIAFERSTA